MAKGAELERSNGGMSAWIKERLSLKSLDYEVPAHANTFLFSLGGLTLVSFIILIVTGIILAQFYVPHPDAANQSIRVLMTEVKVGSLVRGLHFWAAQAAMITVILHLLRVFIYGSYKRPREINWLLGVVLFFVMTGLYYTGTILKWDQEAFEALAHAEEAAKFLGIFGILFSDEFAQGVPLLTRMYSLHVSMLPILVLGLLAVHLLLVKCLKISPLPWGHANTGQKQKFSQHLVKLIGFGLVLSGILILLAVLRPPAIGPVPVEGIEATKPPWLFLSIFSIENWTGLYGLLITAAFLGLALVVVPFIDRAATNNIGQRKSIVVSGVLIFVIAVALTFNGYISQPEQHLSMAEEEGQVEAESQPEAINDSHTADNTETADDEEVQSVKLVELEVLNNALALMNEIKSAVASDDFPLAAEKAVELDKILDGINAEIAAKDQERAADLKEHVHELVELLERPQPNSGEVNDLIEHTRESVEKAKLLFQEGEAVEETQVPELKSLRQALALLGEIEDAVGKEEIPAAAEKTVKLDEILDGINAEIAAKDQERAADLKEHVHELVELLEKSNPDMTDISELVEHTRESVEKALKLFE
ncbi:cytochrome b N-terminal domain-containing protein [Calderihabitans maritimus]|uniref:Cytochrome b/b6 domain-containing protein n=1 Tax=Calderihabitans maritimus TaxID=1246530 RepID=A0A1Z5HQY8_9FIRM|nr:cytochrome b N-terminal domain-containing protein [Calderihabitans maritimus]GAW91939.1 cytochrome b/b6 domain-containing protein [Calderihabitans maritimus]